MKIKKWIKHLFNTFGYEIKGYHSMGVISEAKGKVIEILGYQGKTTVKNKIVKLNNIKDLKASLLDNDEIKEIFKIDNNLIFEMLQEIDKSNEKYKVKIIKSRLFMDYLAIYNKYLCQYSIITDEGIIKQYFNEFYNLLGKEDLDFNFLNRFAFIILKNDFKETYNRASKRYGWSPGEKKVEYKKEYDTYYEMIDNFIIFLKSREIKYLVYSNQNSNNMDVIKDFIDCNILKDL